MTAALWVCWLAITDGLASRVAVDWRNPAEDRRAVAFGALVAGLIPAGLAAALVAWKGWPL